MRTNSSFNIPTFSVATALALGLATALVSGCAEADSASGPAGTALITITSPKAGAVLHVGDSLRVTWTVKNDASRVVDAVGVSLSPDDGKTWGAMHSNSIGPAAANWGKFAWLIPDSLYIATQNKKFALKGNKTCRVKVAQYSTQDPDMIVASEAFTIDP